MDQTHYFARQRDKSAEFLNNSTFHISKNMKSFVDLWARGGVMVKALRYKPAGRWFDSRWCNWNFSVT